LPAALVQPLRFPWEATGTADILRATLRLYRRLNPDNAVFSLADILLAEP
jgi:hypothetical protein